VADPNKPLAELKNNVNNNVKNNRTDNGNGKYVKNCYLKFPLDYYGAYRI
jgi:hypothetical protein